jgi:hypothetical protein
MNRGYTIVLCDNIVYPAAIIIFKTKKLAP